MAAELIGLALMGLFFLVMIAAMIFWIMMIVDCVKRKFKGDNEKVMWVLILILTGIIGGVIYYFMVKKK